MLVGNMLRFLFLFRKCYVFLKIVIFSRKTVLRNKNLFSGHLELYAGIILSTLSSYRFYI